MTPSRTLLIVSLLLAVVALAAAFLPWLGSLWWVLAGITMGVVLLDLVTVHRPIDVELRREVRHSIPVGAWSQVTLSLINREQRPFAIRLHDHHPAWFEVETLPCELTLPQRQSAKVTYRVRPARRGDGDFPGCDLLLLSPLGFWHKKRFLQVEDRVKVFPNFQEISRYALLATDHRLSQMGVKRRQRRGEGNDFHQLREYRPGDSMRQIDWRATSRYRKLISKEYQDERDQQVLFLLDCGRRMRHEEEGRVHLDQALNAMLLLAHVAARQGDAVGFLSFGGPRRWLPPRKGANSVRELLERTYDLASTSEAADYLAAARELMPLQQRRALVVIMTNTRDEDHADLAAAVRLLQRRHLVVVANLRESLLDESLTKPVRNFDDALRFHGVNQYLDNRRQGLSSLRHKGAVILDLQAPQLPVTLVNSYLMIKASGSL
ncbi:MAG: DUF58 domain-containing protein [Candidatus Sedimenticola sp. (ex Thyasira tokunagai)]